MNGLDRIDVDCPADVVDRLLWRNAQGILLRHVVRLDGTCQWCERRSPCSPRRLAERAAAAARGPVTGARRPWHETWTARNDITALLPMLQADFAGGGAWRARNQRGFD